MNLPKHVGGVCPPWPPVPSSLQCCNSALHSVAYTYMLARAFASHSLMFSERRRLKQYAAWKKMNYKTRNPTLLTDQMQTSLQLRRGTTYVIPTSYIHMRGVKIWPWFLIATACIIYYRIVPSLHIRKREHSSFERVGSSLTVNPFKEPNITTKKLVLQSTYVVWCRNKFPNRSPQEY